MEAGTVAVSVPASLAIDFDMVRAHPVVGAPLVEAYDTARTLGGALTHLLSDAGRWIALALLLQHMYFYEREASPWSPYLAVLPTPAEVRHMPMYWSEEEVSLADLVLPTSSPGETSASDWYPGSRGMSALGRTAASALWSKLPEVYGSTSDPAVLSRLNDELRWATAICQSYGFANAAKHGYESLLPLLDLANHHTNASNVQVSVDAQSQPVAFTLEARPTRDGASSVIHIGDPISNHYIQGGSRRSCSDKLLSEYGFVVPTDGDCAQLTLSIDVREEDAPPHLVAARRHALQSAGVTTSASPTVYLLDVSLVRGRPVPQDVLVAARAQALRAGDLIASAASADLTAPVSTSHELRALVRLQSVLLRERARLRETDGTSEVARARSAAAGPDAAPAARRTLDNLLHVHDGAVRTIQWAIADVDRRVEAATATAASSRSPCAAGPRSRPELVAYVQAVNTGMLGAVDAGAVLPSLARSYSAYIAGGHASVLLDVGANAGSTSATLMSLFTRLPTLYDINADPVEGGVLAGDWFVLAGVKVYAFEPVPSTFAKLQERAEKAQWAAGGWQGHRVAVGDQEGNTHVYTRKGEERNRLASLSASAATLQSNSDGKVETVAHPVLVLTLASIAMQLNFTEVFLLKADTEGYDPHVLLGAKELLQRRRIQWLFFEYNAQWGVVESPAVDGGLTLNTLGAVSGWLHEMGHLCYLVTQELLVPLYGGYWHSSYEIRAWSNVLCGLSLSGHAGAPTPSPELQGVVQHYNSLHVGMPDLHLPPCVQESAH